MPELNARRLNQILLLLILLLSAWVKLYAAQLLAWEADYVPLIALGQAWLDGGVFPAVGTLSSVAAYNMPFLVWMQIPALLFTRDVQMVLIATQLAFNLLGTWLMYRLGSRLFSPGAGLIAAALFTFSETGISSAYTAWAQLQLPVFTVAFAFCLYLWKTEGRPWQIASTWIIATAAFMTHFSAILLYGVLLIMWLLLRMPSNIRVLTVGLLISAAMLAPYMTVQTRNDFVDLRAFFSQRSRISQEVLAEYDHLKPGAQAAALQAPTQEAAETALAAQTPQAPDSRFSRGIRRLVSIPRQLIQSARLVFQGELANLRAHQQPLYGLSNLLRVMLEVCFWLGIAHALLSCFRRWQASFGSLQPAQRSFQAGWRMAREQLVDSAAGRNVILLLIVLGIVSGLILVRAGPEQQPSYYTGLVSLQLLMCGYPVFCIASQRRLRNVLVVLIVIFISLAPLDRILRVSHHDRSAHTPQNLSLYANISDAAGWIDSDWAQPGAITISYDLFPEMAYHWWIAAWNTVDESYRIGMALDHLLESYYGLRNSNRNPAGPADQPDYIVTSAPGAERYDIDRFNVNQFGALYVLKPATD